MEIKPELEKLFEEETDKVREILLPLESLTGVQTKKILGCYAAAIEPNFIPWVAATTISARSLEARYAASENLRDEIEEDHQGMLRDFVTKARAQPTPNHFDEVQIYVQNMRRTFGSMDGLTNTALLAYLENTSAAFIPYLADLAKARGSTKYTYTDAHGVADIEHAKQFLWALGHEMEAGYSTPNETIRHATSSGLGFLRGIFVRSQTR